MEKPAQLKQKLQNYKQKQAEWVREKELYLKTINLMQQQIAKYKALNVTNAKKSKHKRASSEEQTFIFNQTNYSSYFPIVVIKSNNWSHKANLRSHLDSVRTLAWQGNHLISSGEDCSLKIWEKEQLKVTIRQHLGPVYSICMTDSQTFTAGAEGVIRKWTHESLLANEMPDYERDLHDDSIWEIIVNQKNKLLVTSSSDQSHKIINTVDAMDQIGVIKIHNDTPTSIDWIEDTKFVSGYVRREKLSVYDVQTCKTLMDYSFEGKSKYSQTNKIQTNLKQKLIATAHQDHFIRFFDLNSNKIVKELAAHSDSVTSICFRPEEHELVSCGHDGNLRIWDMRKFKCLNDVAVHIKKYDESALCLAHNKQQALLAVGGADGLIKLLHPEH